MLNKFIYVFIFLMIGIPAFAVKYLDTELPLPGKTLTNVTAQANTLGSVYAVTANKYKKCRKFNVLDTQIKKQPENVVYNQHNRRVKGNWTENWTIDACGEKVVVPVDFEYRRAGISFDVKEIK